MSAKKIFIHVFSPIKHNSKLSHHRFNYRSTHYMVMNGFYQFLNWFDERAWYPLGRIVGGTVSIQLSLLTQFLIMNIFRAHLNELVNHSVLNIRISVIKNYLFFPYLQQFHLAFFTCIIISAKNLDQYLVFWGCKQMSLVLIYQKNSVPEKSYCITHLWYKLKQLVQ